MDLIKSTCDFYFCWGPRAKSNNEHPLLSNLEPTNQQGSPDGDVNWHHFRPIGKRRHPENQSDVDTDRWEPVAMVRWLHLRIGWLRSLPLWHLRPSSMDMKPLQTPKRNKESLHGEKPVKALPPKGPNVLLESKIPIVCWTSVLSDRVDPLPLLPTWVIPQVGRNLRILRDSIFTRIGN